MLHQYDLMKRYHQQLKKWGFNFISILAFVILSITSCSKKINPNKPNKITTSTTKISGSFFDSLKESDDLVKVNIPHQCVIPEIELEIKQLMIQTLQSQKISGDTKNLDGFATTDYLKFEKINHDIDLFIFGQSLFVRNESLWDEYSAIPYWQFIHKCMSQKKIIFNSTLAPSKAVLPGIPNFDPSAF
jgi:hypothetical protein